MQHLVSFLDETVCKQQELDVQMIQNVKNQKKQRNRVINQTHVKYCGMDKQQIFDKVVLPTLMTICESQNVNIVSAIKQVVDKIASCSPPRVSEDNDVEMTGQENGANFVMNPKPDAKMPSLNDIINHQRLAQMSPAELDRAISLLQGQQL